MSPLCLAGPTGRFLSFEEREEIAVLFAQQVSLREIARRLGRAASTISREIRRNKSSRYLPYRATRAQSETDRRAGRPKLSKLAGNDALREFVQEALSSRSRPSPEQIAVMLRQQFPDDESMRISHEAIYQAIYVQGRGGLRRELHTCLRTGRALRKPHARTETRGKRTGMVLISERPPEVADRAVPGHWEGDLIVGKDSGSAVGTLVERTTRFVMLLHLPNDHTAAAVRDAITAKITTLPKALRRTLTWDQGSELAQHAQLAIDADLDVYFCDPHSPWQRGTNENTNGLLRQYLPKGTDLSKHTAADLDDIADALNQRIRKTLDWRTPTQALDELLSQAQSTGVATTG
jgi:IS30 family transposase